MCPQQVLQHLAQIFLSICRLNECMTHVSATKRSSLTDLAISTISSAKCFLPTLPSWLPLDPTSTLTQDFTVWQRARQGKPLHQVLFRGALTQDLGNYFISFEYVRLPGVAVLTHTQRAGADWRREAGRTDHATSERKRRREREYKREGDTECFLVPAPVKLNTKVHKTLSSPYPSLKYISVPSKIWFTIKPLTLLKIFFCQ